MDTDRELLELAAKAHGGFSGCEYIEDDVHQDAGFLSAGIYVDDGENSFTWNPLTDDGDALRLAMTLAAAGKLRIHVTSDAVTAFQHWDGVWVPITWTFEGTNPSEAFRRTIVRAAAEIGRAK